MTMFHVAYLLFVGITVATTRTEAAPKKGKHHYILAGQATSNVNGEPQYSCPDGYTQKGKGCSRIVSRDPESYCTVGAKTEEGCRTVKPVISSCPEGYTKKCDMDTKECHCTKVTIEKKVRGDCPEGTSDSSDLRSCLKEVPAAIVGRCPAGYRTQWEHSWKHGRSTNVARCSSEEYFSPECHCSKDDAVLSNSKCVYEELVDCSPGQAHSMHHRLLGVKRAKGSLHSHGNPSHHQDGKTVTKQVVSQTCRKRKVSNPVCTCPDGTTPLPPEGHFHHSLTGLRCSKLSIAAAELFCSVTNKAVADPAECLQTREVAVPYLCPKGFQEGCTNQLHGHKNCKCIQFSRADEIENCADGYSLKGGVCGKVVPSDTKCPGGWDKVGARCERIETAPPIVTYTSLVTCVGKGCNGTGNLKKHPAIHTGSEHFSNSSH